MRLDGFPRILYRLNMLRTGGALLDWFHRHKPGASLRAHVFLSALMWTVIGAYLLGLGSSFFLSSLDGAGLLCFGGAAFLGVLKGKMVLDRSAGRMLSRIGCRGGGRCIGGFLSLKSWLMVGAMMLFGRLLRWSPLPAQVVWSLYVAVGSGLLFSSRLFWAEWRRLGPGNAGAVPS